MSWIQKDVFSEDNCKLFSIYYKNGIQVTIITAYFEINNVFI